MREPIFGRYGRAAKALLLASAIACQACEDFSPVDYRGPVFDADIDVSHPDSASANECRECVIGDSGACHSAFAACSQQQKCQDVFECMLAFDCLRQIRPENPSADVLPKCATDCIAAAHTSINEILLPAVMSFACMAKPENCRAACFAPE
jgi:hypothetical protein